MLKNILFLILALFIFAGCSTKTVTTAPKPEPVFEPKKENSWVSKALYQEYDKWCETPYQYGGQTLQGTDCSSLVQQVYQDAFGIKIPRTSVEQAHIGYEVPRNSCKEGDLVFFKVDSKTRHSGIMIDKEKFLHASTSEGVKISQLNDPYWKSKYLQTRRVLP
ncbi:MAG: NlpC/P60 family protein [Sulfurimonas sp.]|jgi:cell wall-associated NlpC family hydrolase